MSPMIDLWFTNSTTYLDEFTSSCYTALMPNRPHTPRLKKNKRTQTAFSQTRQSFLMFPIQKQDAALYHITCSKTCSANEWKELECWHTLSPSNIFTTFIERTNPLHVLSSLNHQTKQFIFIHMNKLLRLTTAKGVLANLSYKCA